MPVFLSTRVKLGENSEVTCAQYCGSTGKIWTNELSGIHVFFFFFFLTAEASTSLIVRAKIT